MNENDDKLRKALRQWRDIEPSATFEVDVHRRIRLATVPAAPRWAWLFTGWAPVGAAAGVALLIGTWMGVRSAPRTPTTFVTAPVTFLADSTLAGSYLKLEEKAR